MATKAQFVADETGQEFLIEATYDHDGVQATSAIGRDGREYPDPVPMAPPVGYNQPPDLMTMIRTMIQSEKAREVLQREEFETFEEADDFDVLDDPLDPRTPYEAVFDPPPPAAKGDERGGVTPAATGTPPASEVSNPVASRVPESASQKVESNEDKGRDQSAEKVLPQAPR